MNKQRKIDISVGIFMLFGLAALLFLVVKVSGLSSQTFQKYYEVNADFVDIGGLKAHAPCNYCRCKSGGGQ